MIFTRLGPKQFVNSNLFQTGISSVSFCTFINCKEEKSPKHIACPLSLPDIGFQAISLAPDEFRGHPVSYPTVRKEYHGTNILGKAGRYRKPVASTQNVTVLLINVSSTYFHLR